MLILNISNYMRLLLKILVRSLIILKQLEDLTYRFSYLSKNPLRVSTLKRTLSFTKKWSYSTGSNSSKHSQYAAL